MLASWIIAALTVGVAATRAEQVISSPSPTITADLPAFTYSNESFLLHGEPYTIIGGQMDPQRIPYQYWRDRLSKARAMGLNTIFSYIFWNNLEPTQGVWLSDQPQNDIASYFRIAQEEGLNVVLRPGPYVCGEHEWGGFPAWLSEIPGMVVRTNNTPFLEETRKYIVNLAETSEFADLQVSRGGPILMVQVENEYGSFGENHNYTAALRDILLESFEVPLYTNDGGVDWTLAGGEVPNVLAEIDGGSWALPARDLYITDPSELGPLLDGEYYTWAPDQWGSHNPHNTTVGNPDTVAGFVSDIAYHLLNYSASISFYMVHGGTNFGFDNGAMWQNRTTVFTSSYDYGAPIDETGRTTDLYFKMRDAILPFVANGSVPEPPANLPRSSIPQFTLCSSTSLFDARGEKTTAASPLTMEALGQSYGFTLYEHTANTTVQGFVQPGDRPRDRVLVYVNDEIAGVMDSQYQHPLNVSVSLQPGDKLQLLIENLGRVDYYSRGNPYRNYVQDPWKGVKGDVSVGGQVLNDWEMYSIQLDSLPTVGCNGSKISNGSSTDSPMFYHGSFMGPSITYNSSMTLDTFITVPSGVKGNVWVNGFHLGRYWLVGPQQSLYLPGSVINPEEPNDVVILELEPWQMNSTSMVAYGVSERSWGNKPDPDCLGAIK
ncbi:glycosyl hydrolase family 35 protein [Seiridium cupressi]